MESDTLQGEVLDYWLGFRSVPLKEEGEWVSSNYNFHENLSSWLLNLRYVYFELQEPSGKLS